MSEVIDIFADDQATVPQQQPAKRETNQGPRWPQSDLTDTAWKIACICLIVFVGFKFLLSFDGSGNERSKPLSDRYDLIVIDDYKSPDEGARNVMAADQFWADLKQNHGMDWHFYDLNGTDIEGTKLQKRAAEIGEPVIVVQEKSGDVLYCEKMAGTTDQVRKQIGRWLK